LPPHVQHSPPTPISTRPSPAPARRRAAAPISNACAGADFHLHQRQCLARSAAACFHQRQCLARSAGAGGNVSHLQLPTISGRPLDRSRQGASVIWPYGEMCRQMVSFFVSSHLNFWRSPLPFLLYPASPVTGHGSFRISRGHPSMLVSRSQYSVRPLLRQMRN
jgi:hypothetical protein